LAAPANNSSSAKQRILTGLALGAVFLGALLGLPTSAWSVVMLAVVGLGAWEWANLVKFSAGTRLFYSLATPVLTLITAQLAPPEAIAVVAVIVWLLLVPVWLARGWSLPGGSDGGLIGWMLLLPTGYAAIHLHAHSPRLLLACILLAVIADTAAYFTGRRFGRRKLAPRISPGKSWEGAFGAALAVAIYGLLVSLFALHADPLHTAWLLLFVLILFVASILGDLFESHAKRQAGIKDSGHWLPGHGGVLDRIDSLTAVLPLALCFLLLWQ
jgi:phosphatidate cytidylyltransferase